MRVQELRELLEAIPDGWPVILWDDYTGRRGDALYATATDGELTISARLTDPGQ